SYSSLLCLSSSLLHPPPLSKLFPYTTLFRSGWGLKDKEFFSQSIPLLKELDTPYYAKLITNTNHFPFDLDEADRTLEPYDKNSRSEEHTSELQSRFDLVCRLLLEKKKRKINV